MVGCRLREGAAARSLRTCLPRRCDGCTKARRDHRAAELAGHLHLRHFLIAQGKEMAQNLFVMRFANM